MGQSVHALSHGLQEPQKLRRRPKTALSRAYDIPVGRDLGVQRPARRQQAIIATCGWEETRWVDQGSTPPV